MIIAEYLPPRSHVLWQLARQMGIRYAIVNAKPQRTGLNPPWDIDALRQVQREFSAAGLKIHGLEGDQFDMSRIKLGLDGREEDIGRFCRMLHNMGELGIPLLCYNFMAQIGWFRSNVSVGGCGGALVSQFDLKEVPPTPTRAGEVPAERIWENYRHFIQQVMPVAEKAGIQMALHPDDPPLPSLRGIGRIFGTPEAFERAYALAPSPSNGVTFCRANFKLMGVDVSEWVRRLAAQKRLFFLHLRDVRGTADHFVEVFHDEAPAALMDTLRVCQDVGVHGHVHGRGPIRGSSRRADRDDGLHPVVVGRHDAARPGPRRLESGHLPVPPGNRRAGELPGGPPCHDPLVLQGGARPADCPLFVRQLGRQLDRPALDRLCDVVLRVADGLLRPRLRGTDLGAGVGVRAPDAFTGSERASRDRRISHPRGDCPSQAGVARQSAQG